ncbi:glycoside hydrolase family 1 protein [Clostridiaceae bacterium M8S5]|nr:glycoside hydrolase family 1 protein [Clostridiaceae bacterium M8S5]
MKELILPKKILLGCATAATQIEGGDKNSNWYHWSQKGKIANNESSIVAADHYNRYVEDINLMKEMNLEVYRMSIEWSRIEPKEGTWSQEGILHYQDEIKKLIKAGIKPLVTLHHFSHPQWFEEIGAWTNRDSVNYFKRFVKKVVETIGDYVSEYCTINEPNVFVTDTYMDGKYPPGHNDDIVSYFKAAKNLILAHLHAYQLIHKIRKKIGYDNTMVGFAHHLAYFECKNSNPLTKLSKRLMDYSFHGLFFNGMVNGHLTFPVGFGYPIGKGIYCDFIGVNYYSRHIIHPSKNPAMLFGEVKVEEDLPDFRVNDLGWELYPQGLYQVVKKTYDKYKLPIFITENGIPDAKDIKRSKFIYDHLAKICKLISDGVDVRRYYHWSLLDNLEWNDGYGPRFGLIEVDYDTLERNIRKSGVFYSKICKEKRVTKNMIETYL